MKASPWDNGSKLKSLVQGLNAAATAGFEPRTVCSEVRRRNRLATAPPKLGMYHLQLVAQEGGGGGLATLNVY